MKKRMHVEEYLMVSWLQALLFMTDHHWQEEPQETTVSLLPPLPAPTQISTNIGSRLRYLQCMEALHTRSNSSFSC